MRRTDGTSINPNHLAYRWTVEVKGRRSIKGREKDKNGDRKFEERNTVAIHHQTCNVISKQYIRTTILGLSQGRYFFIFQLSIFIFLSLSLSSLLYDQLKPNFPTHFSLQIHCFGLLVPKSILVLG